MSSCYSFVNFILLMKNFVFLMKKIFVELRLSLFCDSETSFLKNMGCNVKQVFRWIMDCLLRTISNNKFVGHPIVL